MGREEQSCSPGAISRPTNSRPAVSTSAGFFTDRRFCGRPTNPIQSAPDGAFSLEQHRGPAGARGSPPPVTSNEQCCNVQHDSPGTVRLGDGHDRARGPRGEGHPGSSTIRFVLVVSRPRSAVSADTTKSRPANTFRAVKERTHSALEARKAGQGRRCLSQRGPISTP